MWCTIFTGISRKKIIGAKILAMTQTLISFSFHWRLGFVTLSETSSDSSYICCFLKFQENMSTRGFFIASSAGPFQSDHGFLPLWRNSFSHCFDNQFLSPLPPLYSFCFVLSKKLIWGCPGPSTCFTLLSPSVVKSLQEAEVSSGWVNGDEVDESQLPS